MSDYSFFRDVSPDDTSAAMSPLDAQAGAPPVTPGVSPVGTEQIITDTSTTQPALSPPPVEQKPSMLPLLAVGISVFKLFLK
jgi:hypothetical protein